QTGSSLGLLLLGHATADIGDADQAIATFARVRDPLRRFEADQAIALLYRRRKDFTRASEYYERALAREAGATVLYNAGLTRAEARRPESAGVQHAGLRADGRAALRRGRARRGRGPRPRPPPRRGALGAGPHRAGARRRGRRAAPPGDLRPPGARDLRGLAGA